jgi:hypothetical protein
MKCCTLPENRDKVKGKHKISKGSGTGSKLAKAAHACKGKKKVAFKKCVKAKIKKL